MAMTSPTQTASFSTQKLLARSPPPPLIIEPPKQESSNAPQNKKSPVDFATFRSLETSPVNVPQLLKMVSDPLNEYCRESTQPPSSSSTQRLCVSRSVDGDDDNDNDEERSERNFGSISPIMQRSHVTGAVTKTNLSALGAARASDFRAKFRKSHTCGSLFANCNCNDSQQPSTATHVQSAVPITIHAPDSLPACASAARHISTPNSSFHLSISPSDFSTSPTSPSSTGATLNTSSITSGYHSTLSKQNSSATNCSLQLSRDESINASFDYTTADTPPSIRPISPRTAARSAFILGSASSNDSTNSCSDPQFIPATGNQSTQAAKQASTETETFNQTKKLSKQLRISNTATATCTSPTPSRKSESFQKSRRLFHTYSHPDTDFVFTDANKHPSRESLTQVHSAGDNLALPTKHDRPTKRSSSPNIGQYHTLDVAVYPDIPVRVSPKHSPITETRRVQSPLSRLRSTQQRRRLFQRSHEIESGGSTSESEYSASDAKGLSSSSAAAAREIHSELAKNLKKLQSSSNEASSPTKSLTPAGGGDKSFIAAQKYFAESGILGPIHTSSNLIRKTSKILQDSNVHEQIRKTSMTLRANPLVNGKKKFSLVTSPTSSSSSEQQIFEDFAVQQQSSQSKLTLQLKNNNNANMETPANIMYAAAHLSSPQSPHTLATTCGFSPNLATQSGMISDDHDVKIKSLLGEVVSLKDVIKSRDAEIVKLRREIHKLKSVLQQTTNSLPISKDDLLHSPTKAPFTQVQLSQPICVYCKNKLADQASKEEQTSQPRTQPGSTTATDSDSSSTNSSTATCADTNTVTCALSGAGSKEGMGLDVAAMDNVDVEKFLAPTQPKATATLAPPTLQCNGLATRTSQQNSQTQQQQLQQQATVLKKQGVSGESCETSKQQSINVPITKFDKDYSSKQLIKEAIMDNDFLKNIDASQVRELVEAMYPLSVAKGEFVIREGEVGAHLYVSAEGEFEVVKNGQVLGVMGSGKAFGELAILYNCTRTASVRVLCDARVWVLDRRVFQQIMMRTGMQRIENSVNFLKSVPLLKNLSEELLAKIADVLEVEFYPAGTYIIRQGASGDTFFLISQGSVKVTQKLLPTAEEKEIRTLERGDYFGEQALINEDKRTANIIAMAPGVECLTLDRESFTQLIGDLCELKEKNYGDENRVLAMKYAEKTKEIFGANIQQEFPDMKLTDLEVIATLGIGGFGRVELVKAYRENRVDIFALKCLKKRHIVDTKQEEHVFSERTIMLSCNSPFICRLYRTFRDEKYVYMLLEACMGGEIWTMLRDRGAFEENAAQFIIGCVLQAFEYLHARGIIYRDLKPENLMLDERGYVKLVDFGFAKYIGNSSKTWTFCGTPEYVAPEIILNKGHDRAVDYWALGVLIHELLNGTPPFTANDPMKTYNIILKGIDMIDFPKHMSRSAVMLIKRLCRDVPPERLGYQKGGIQDIKKHKWFLGFDWDGLQSQLLIPPFVRPIAHPTDTTYFDKFQCDPEEPPDEFSGWDADF